MHPDLRNAVAQARINDIRRSADAGRIAATVRRRSPPFGRLRVARGTVTPAPVQIAGVR
jgi:hypothetical protein